MSESLIIEGKQYISARRAAEIAEYSKDYVGQLCRSGKLVCRMVGRFWYIDEKSLIKHKEESFKANQTSFGSSAYFSKQSFAGNAGSGSVSADMISGFSFVSALKDAMLVSLAVIAVFIGSAAIASEAAPTSLQQNFSQALSQTLNGNTASAYTAMLSVGAILRSSFENGYSMMASIVSPAAKPAGALSNGSDGEIDPSDSSGVAHGGLVVVPENGSSTAANDEKLTQTISNSFSDNVTITPGPGGTTGVITPRFRTVSGHDFLYVLVPVKTSSSTPAQHSQL